MKIDFFFLLIILFIIYHVYMSNKIEAMSDVSTDITEAIKQVYLVDVEAIRNLSNVATQLQAGGLTIPGDLTIKGKLNVSSDITTAANLNSANLNVTGSFNMLPKGTIIAFNFETAPPGWALCDGTNGTPDLRGRFIRMHSSSLGGFNEWGGKVLGGNITAYEKSIGGNSRGDPNTLMLNHKFGDRAGTDHQTLSIQELPPHRHYTADANAGRSWGWGWSKLGNGNNGFGGGGGANFGTIKDENLSQAFLTGDGTETGIGGWGHNNQPPYYVLSYIIKL